MKFTTGYTLQVWMLRHQLGGVLHGPKPTDSPVFFSREAAEAARHRWWGEDAKYFDVVELRSVEEDETPVAPRPRLESLALDVPAASSEENRPLGTRERAYVEMAAAMRAFARWDDKLRDGFDRDYQQENLERLRLHEAFDRAYVALKAADEVDAERQRRRNSQATGKADRAGGEAEGKSS